MQETPYFCCICIEVTEDFENICLKDANGTSHSDKLAVCDPQQSWEDTTLALCNTCLEKLNAAYDFIKICKQSELLRAEKLFQLKEENNKKKPENELFTCDICKKCFGKKRSLKMHITKAHLCKRQSPKLIKKVKSCKIENDEKENDQLFSSDSNVPSKTNQDENKIYLEGNPKSKNKVEDDSYVENNDDIYSSEDDQKVIKPKQKRSKKPESFTCEYCGKQFNRHQHWSAHIRSKHTFERPYKCKLCDASFITSHSLLVHKRNHNNEKPYICSICGKGFVCSADLFHHTKIHLNKKEYQCNICEKRFNTTSILRTHKIVKHTEPKEWKYICQICNRHFPINSGLKLHMKRHTGIKDHPCHVCGKKFFNKSEVTKHILSHSNHKKYKCTYCDEKEYKNKEGLNKHLKVIHNVGNWKPPKLEKKYSCTMCPKMFLFNNKLQRHILTHTGEKPFKCDYCEKRFTDNYYKKVHCKKEHNIKAEVVYTELMSVQTS